MLPKKTGRCLCWPTACTVVVVDVHTTRKSPHYYYIFLLLPQYQEYCDSGSVRYMHVSGVKLGDNSEYDSFGKLHVHIALVLHNVKK